MTTPTPKSRLQSKRQTSAKGLTKNSSSRAQASGRYRPQSLATQLRHRRIVQLLLASASLAVFVAITLAATILTRGDLGTRPSLAATTQPAIFTSDRYRVSPLSYGAKCNGRTDDRAAFAKAFAALGKRTGGGVLRLPVGSCRIVSTASALTLEMPSNTAIEGYGVTSRLLFDCDQPSAYRELFRPAGVNIGFSNLSIVRVNSCTGVLMNLSPVTNFQVSGVVMDGLTSSAVNYVHGMMIQQSVPGQYAGISLNKVTMKNLSYGFFEDSSSVATVNGFSVTSSKFSSNYADDLEFNAPAGTFNNVKVTDSSFSSNQATTEDAGIAIGLANVQGATISRNKFSYYRFDPVHLEDRTAYVTIDDNTFQHCFTAATSYSSHVLIIQDVHDVVIRGNQFDTTGESNYLYAVYVGSAGTGRMPYNVSVTENTFLLRSQAVPLYNEDIPTVTFKNNMLL